MRLRKGKTKNILEGSINAALLAVEVYNKPRTTFRSQAYIVLMIIAWTRLFHAYFNKTIGNRYYHKEKNGRYKIIDEERKAWELETCIDEYGSLTEPVKENLRFFIHLRNKIEHRNVTEKEVDVSIFGECQSLLYNYENLLIQLFGVENALNECLVFSLQFSHMRLDEQRQANKSVLSADAREIQSYIENYRSSLGEDIANSQEFSIKLLQIPKISNTNRNDIAIEFVRWDELDSADREMYQKIVTIIKDKRVVVEAKNVGKLRPKEVIKRVNENILHNFNQYYHMCLYTVFTVRPRGGDPNPNETNTKYCHYDEVHSDYIYQDSWVDFIVKLFEVHRVTKENIRQAYKTDEKWDINKFS